MLVVLMIFLTRHLKHTAVLEIKFNITPLPLPPPPSLCPPTTAENVGSLCKVYGDNFEKLLTVLSQRSLRSEKNTEVIGLGWKFILTLSFPAVSSLHDVEWRVDYVLSSSAVKVQYNLHCNRNRAVLLGETSFSLPG